MSQQVQTLDTSGLVQLENTIKNAIPEFQKLGDKVRETSNGLMNTWVGKGKVEYETQSELIFMKINDISEELTDLYKMVVSAEKTYIDADQAAAKAFSMNG